MSQLVLGVPGPRGYPFLGVTPSFLKDPLGVLLAGFREFGDVVRLPLGRQQLLVVSEPALIQTVLVDQREAFTKHGGMNEMLKPLLGNGLLNNADEASWLRHRHMLQPAFKKEQMAGYIPAITSEAERAARSFEQGLATGEPVDVLRVTTRLALRVALRALFSEDVDDQDVERVANAVTFLQEQIRRWMFSPWSPAARWPTPGNLRFMRELKALDALIMRLIHDRRRSTAHHEDLLEFSLRARAEDGERMAEDQLRDELMTMLLAGHETTANALAWAIYLAATHPRAAEDLAREADEVGSAPDQLALLPRARAFLSETMRMYPPVWLFTRTTDREVQLGGYRIPAGATIAVSPYVVHRHPRYWAEPERFDPARFDGARPLAVTHPYAYLPFGGGPRKCIGAQFGLLEGTIALLEVARRFSFEVADPDVKAYAQVTLRPTHLRVRVRGRCPPPPGPSAIA